MKRLYIYLHLPYKSTIHVGKYAIPMDGMGWGNVVEPRLNSGHLYHLYTTYIPFIYHLYIAFWGVIGYRSHLFREPETTIEQWTIEITHRIHGTIVYLPAWKPYKSTIQIR